MEKTNKTNSAYLMGIAGAGMSALAVLLKEAGWEVSGSDSGAYEPIAGYLKKNGITFFNKYSADNIPKDANLIVIGKHAELTEENVEVETARKSGIEIKSLPEALAMFTEGKENLLVAGSFGKSTSTALMAWILKEAGKDPSYFIGALPVDMERSSHLSHIGTGDFVLEGDEYPSSNWDSTSKFLHFNPSSVLLISAEHDHINIFPTEESYKEPYRKLVEKIPAQGLLIYNKEAKNTEELIKGAKCRTVSYSLQNDDTDWQASNIKYENGATFDLMHKGEKVVEIKTPLLGNHNIENIIGVGTFLLENHKVTPEEFAKSVATFHGIKRRIELLNPGAKIPVYEGFGSSYEKAKVIFDTLALHFPTKKIIAVFEPHAFSWRNRDAVKWYGDVFKGVSEVIVLPPPTHGQNTHEQLSHDEILNAIKNTSVHKAQNEKGALDIIKTLAKDDSIIALISSGSLFGLTKSIPNLLEQK